MEIDFCRKCPHWEEFICVDKNSAFSIMSMGCRCDADSFSHIIEKDSSFMEEALHMHHRKWSASFRSRDFHRIAEEPCIRKWFRKLEKGMRKRKVPKECERYAEHMLHKWNRSNED